MIEAGACFTLYLQNEPHKSVAFADEEPLRAGD